MRIFMTIEPGSIFVGKCYATSNKEVRKVLEVDGKKVSYVVRGKMAFPAWDKESWHATTRETFASEVNREVPCDWHAS